MTYLFSISIIFVDIFIGGSFFTSAALASGSMKGAGSFLTAETVNSSINDLEDNLENENDNEDNKEGVPPPAPQHPVNSLPEDKGPSSIWGWAHRYKTAVKKTVLQVLKEPRLAILENSLKKESAAEENQNLFLLLRSRADNTLRAHMKHGQRAVHHPHSIPSAEIPEELLAPLDAFDTVWVELVQEFEFRGYAFPKEFPHRSPKELLQLLFRVVFEYYEVEVPVALSKQLIPIRDQTKRGTLGFRFINTLKTLVESEIYPTRKLLDELELLYKDTQHLAVNGNLEALVLLPSMTFHGIGTQSNVELAFTQAEALRELQIARAFENGGTPGCGLLWSQHHIRIRIVKYFLEAKAYFNEVVEGSSITPTFGGFVDADLGENSLIELFKVLIENEYFSSEPDLGVNFSCFLFSTEDGPIEDSIDLLHEVRNWLLKVDRKKFPQKFWQAVIDVVAEHQGCKTAKMMCSHRVESLFALLRDSLTENPDLLKSLESDILRLLKNDVEVQIAEYEKKWKENELTLGLSHSVPYAQLRNLLLTTDMRHWVKLTDLYVEATAWQLIAEVEGATGIDTVNYAHTKTVIRELVGQHFQSSVKHNLLFLNLLSEFLEIFPTFSELFRRAEQSVEQFWNPIFSEFILNDLTIQTTDALDRLSPLSLLKLASIYAIEYSTYQVPQDLEMAEHFLSLFEDQVTLGTSDFLSEIYREVRAAVRPIPAVDTSQITQNPNWLTRLYLTFQSNLK